jgi:hypothetical protein
VNHKYLSTVGWLMILLSIAILGARLATTSIAATSDSSRSSAGRSGIGHLLLLAICPFHPHHPE